MIDPSEIKIALAVIAGEDALEQGFARMLKSVEGKVDGIYVSYNGADWPDSADDLWEAVDPEIFREGAMHYFEWCDDFAAARQHSFEMVAENKSGIDYDMIVWLDCDDVVPPETDFREIGRRILDKRAHGATLPYWYAVEIKNELMHVRYEHFPDCPANEFQPCTCSPIAHAVEPKYNPLIIHDKPRVLRADVRWTWEQPVHENPYGPPATRIIKVDDQSIVHLRGEGDKRSRNRRITARWYREHKHDQMRSVLYMGREMYAEAEVLGADDPGFKEVAENAILLLREYLDQAVPDDECYGDNLLLVRLNSLLGQPDRAIDLALQGIKLHPTWPAAYVTIAETYLACGLYDEAIEWAKTTRNACSQPDTTASFDPHDLEYKPLMVEGHALMALRRFDDAMYIFGQALEIRDDEHTRERYQMAIDEANANVSGDAQTDDDVREMRDHRWGTSPEKSIAFWTAPLLEPWDAQLIEERGSGGTEMTVMRVAQELAQRGWRVVIFGTPRREGIDEHGVEWYQSGRWHPDEPFTVTVSVRVPQIFDANVNSQCRVLWLHDVNVGPVQFENGRDRFSSDHIDVIVTPSQWHAGHLLSLYEIDESIVFVINNGFDRDLFLSNNNVERNKTKFIYASSPDRGLVRLLQLWPQIRDAYPDAALGVYYGWEYIDKIIASGSPTSGPLIALKARVTAMLDELGGVDGGIHWQGRVNQAQLAQEMRGDDGVTAAGMMLAPNNFCETGGIVYMQAMTAGVIPIVPALGNLPDLVGDKRLIVDGPPDSEVFGEMFLARIDEVMNYSTRNVSAIIDSLQKRTLPYTWKTVVDHWESLFDHVTRTKS